MPNATQGELAEFGRRIRDAINELVERYGAEHPLLDTLIERRLEQLLESERG